MSACEKSVSEATSGGGDGGKVERQVGKLESDVEHIKTEVGSLRADVRELRSEIRSEVRDIRSEMGQLRSDMGQLRSDTHSELGKLRDVHERDFRILFGAIIVVAIGIASIMAKAFGWLK